MGVISEFQDFLAEYKVMGLAVAFIIGTALTALVQSLVNNIIMPIVGIVLPKGGWETATVNLGPAAIGAGAFLAAAIDFIIIAFVVFLIVKMMPTKKEPAKAPA
jgi:large conductance mechanosensitive channel